MSLVSAVSHTLMDKCEIERNPISLVATALGDAHLKCCIQMYYALALITKGSVRTLVRSVEESNGAEAWRLIHSRYAPDTQNRQYALMQKIMMPAKLWCDHAEGFESGLRAWELDVGKWERASGTALADAVKYTMMMNMAPIFLRSSLQLGTYANSAALRTALLQWCYSSRNFGANPTMSAGNGTSADDDRMQVDSLKKGKGTGKGKHQNQEGIRTTSTTNTSSTDINTCKNCGRTGHWEKDCWRPGGGAHDNSTSNSSNTQKGKSHKKGKGKSKHVDVVETNQPSETASTVSYPSQTPSTIGALLSNSNVEPWIMGVTINSVSTGRQDGYLLLHSGAQLHACPVTYRGQKVPLPDPGIHTASGARL